MVHPALKILYWCAMVYNILQTEEKILCMCICWYFEVEMLQHQMSCQMRDYLALTESEMRLSRWPLFAISLDRLQSVLVYDFLKLKGGSWSHLFASVHGLQFFRAALTICMAICVPF